MGIEKRSNKRKIEKMNEEIRKRNEEIRKRFEPIMKKMILDNIQKENKKK